MKRVPKPVFFIVAILILVLGYTSIFGVSTQYGDIKTTVIKGIGDIRWGIDIRGGVEATFKPAGDVDATDEQLESAKAIIETRLISNNITDYELYQDTATDSIILRYPWKEDEKDFDPEKAIEEIASTAKLTFRPGNSYESQELDSNGEIVYKTPTGETEKVLMDGSNVKSAQAGMYTPQGAATPEYAVFLELKDGSIFKKITEEYKGKVVSIWMDDIMLSAPNINEVIPDGKCTISGDFTVEEATQLALKINAGALPFELETTGFGSISPTLGESSLIAMAYAGIGAFILIALFMLIMYRLPGFIAVLALIGQVSISIAAISGYFAIFPSFTMTLPGIAGLILSIGMGADANIITAERIKEELRGGRTLDRAIERGTKNSFSAIFDGNATVVIVALILLLVFGPTNILSAFFGPSTTGTIYSFGYTLLMGVISNFIMGVAASRLMLKSVAGYKFARKTSFYGGAKK